MIFDAADDEAAGFATRRDLGHEIVRHVAEFPQARYRPVRLPALVFVVDNPLPRGGWL